MFPLRSVAQIKFLGGQPEITRDNLAQIVPVTAEIGGAHDLGSTLAAVQKALQKPGVLPPDVYYTIGGAYKPVSYTHLAASRHSAPDQIELDVGRLKTS